MVSIDEPVLNDDGTVVCHECDETFSRPGYHWSHGSCPHPELPPDMARLVRGLMLGDGTLRRHTSNPFVQTYMINDQFLEWLDNELAWLTTGVSLYRTADRGAELSRNNGDPSADASDYHDVYVMQTRTMPQFSEYESWYDGGNGKRFADDLTLTPIDMKVWFACDGSLNWDRRYPNASPYATLGASAELESPAAVCSMFERSTFPHEPRIDSNMIRFSVDETVDLLEWMGDAPPGFEYKWALDSLEQYEDLKRAALGDD